MRSADFWSLPLRRPRIGLALGSGAARGWAHVGVIQALEEEGIAIDVVSGTSAGAFIGAFYAADEMEGLLKFSEQVTRFHHNLRFMDFTLDGRGILEGERFIRLMGRHLKARSFTDLRKPLGITATDLVEMTEVHITQGALLPAVRASVAVPGMVKPLEWEGRRLVDGGVLSPVPVNLARSLGADIVIAVDITTFPPRNMDNVLNVMYRTIDTMMNRIQVMNRHIDKPEVVIQPDLDEVSFFDNHLSHLAIERGYQAARAVMPQIKSLLGSSLAEAFKKASAQIRTDSLGRLLSRFPVLRK
ncbi:MAG: patatin-like phospholipase family protein [Leptospiraceae bacterium]|nr:patatin-like phospholipase family protein [Leptospiraceae bacterium]